MKKVAVILSGCGFRDGAEINEAVSTFIALGNEKASYDCFAPRLSFAATSHVSGDAEGSRDVFEESARIARGQIKDLKDLQEADYDALVLPGGFGVAKNLCDWATKGAACTVLPEVARPITAFHQASKPIGAICIAPALVAKVLGKNRITVTLGDSPDNAKEIEKTGAIHEDCPVNEYISDRNNKVLSTPAFMYETQPHLAFQGISKMIKELVEMA